MGYKGMRIRIPIERTYTGGIFRDTSPRSGECPLLVLTTSGYVEDLQHGDFERVVLSHGNKDSVKGPLKDYLVRKRGKPMNFIGDLAKEIPDEIRL